MPRPKIDLEPHRKLIQSWFEDGASYDDIRTRLQDRGVSISFASLRAKLHELGFRRRGGRTGAVVTDALKARVLELHTTMNLTDEQVVAVLERKGYHVTLWRLRHLRYDMQLYKLIRGLRAECMDVVARDAVRQELDFGHVEDLGRGQLYHHMRSNFGIVGRNRVERVIKELNPEAVARRRAKLHERHGQLITPGPNYVWSMDGYCKLELFGIQVYAAIDVYLRLITWIYAGTSGRSQMAVAVQYLQTLADGAVMPRCLRTDRGSETSLVADIHFQLSGLVRTREDGTPLEFSDCFKYGTSKQNSRIESWWNQQAKGSTSRWRSFFHSLADDTRTGARAGARFDRDSIADRIALKAVYMPIIRHELIAYTKLWNTHTIRKQRKRPYLVSGIPEILFKHPELSGGEQQGFAAPAERVLELLEQLQSFDLHAYLPDQTLQWCDRILAESGLGRVDGRMFDVDDGARLHEKAYQHLREAARHHIDTGRQPMLGELSPPSAPWTLSTEAARVFQAAGLQDQQLELQLELPWMADSAEGVLQ